jgi:hypothetical protein
MRDGSRQIFCKDAGNAQRDQDPGWSRAAAASVVPNVQFEILCVPRTARGRNWTVSLHAVEPAALFEASDIVADIQDAYVLTAAA